LSQILVNNQSDAFFHVFIYSFHLSTCFEHQVLIIRRSNCIITSSGMIRLEINSFYMIYCTRWLHCSYTVLFWCSCICIFVLLV